MKSSAKGCSAFEITMGKFDAPLQDTCALDPGASRPMFWMEMEHVACTSPDDCDSTLVNPRSSSAATTTHGRAGLENRRMLAISGASYSLAPNTRDCCYFKLWTGTQRTAISFMG